jgi:PPM family protein phosphatase
MTLALRYLAHSETGLVRKNNQDSAYASPTMLIVADGMGGAAAGDLASAVAVSQVAEIDLEKASGEEMLTALDTAISRASNLISELIEADPQLDGMGSTVCGVMFDGSEQMALANVGDSRTYRYRAGKLTRLSRDHSWVQSLVDEGRITEAEALEHPHRSLILKVVNGQPQHTPDLEMVDVAAGDRLLVCSDGLCGMVTDEVIASRMDGDRADVMAALVRVAHLEGAQDNITIIVADVVEGEPEGEPQILGAADLIDIHELGDESTLVQRLTTQSEPESASAEPLSEEEVRYAPTAKRRGWQWVKIALAVLLPIALVLGGGAFWYSYTQSQYYVGANQDSLGIYQGVPEPVFGLPLSHLVQSDDTRIADLPPYYQEQVQATIRANSLAAANESLVFLKEKAAACIIQRQQVHPDPTATPTSTLTPVPTSGATVAASAGTATPTPSASESSAAQMEC